MTTIPEAIQSAEWTPPRAWGDLPHAMGLVNDEDAGLFAMMRRGARIRGSDA